MDETTATVEKPSQNGHAAGKAPLRAVSVSELLPGVTRTATGGFVAANGAMTPKARKSQAQIDREARIATDVTKTTPFEYEGKTYHIATLGRDDRVLWRESLSRAMKNEGEFILCETSTDREEKLSLVTLLCCVRCHDGAAYFGVAEILAWDTNTEDQAILGELLGQCLELNPVLFGIDATVEGEKKIDPPSS